MKSWIKKILQQSADKQFKRTLPYATGGTIKAMPGPVRPIPALSNERYVSPETRIGSVVAEDFPVGFGPDTTVTVTNKVHPDFEAPSLSAIEAAMVDAQRAQRMVEADLVKLASTFKGVDIVCDPNLRGMSMKLHVSPVAYEQIKKEARDNGTE